MLYHQIHRIRYSYVPVIGGIVKKCKFRTFEECEQWICETYGIHRKIIGYKS